jgi:aminopeptidase YwaD
MIIDDREFSKDLNVLCRDIGERLAGSAADKQAADHIFARLRAAGLPDVERQMFPCTQLVRATIEVTEPHGRSWRAVKALPIVGAPSTPDRKRVEGKIVWITLPEGQHRLKPRSLQGCIAVVFGPLPSSPKAHREMLAASPLVIVHIDDRMPFAWAKSDGTFPFLRRSFGVLPTVSVPYMDAWRWRRDNIDRLRVRIDIVHRESRSTNIIAELSGTEPDLPAITLTSHLDTQPGNCGADDNAGGVACVLALARALAGTSPRRTIRFAAFGAEEQLSVGAADYVRSRRIRPSNTGLVLNFDSVASHLGHYVIWAAADEALPRAATRLLSASGIDAVVQSEITPYCDSFPFNRAGIPSLWFRRQNFPGGKWQHHSSHDNLDNISIPQLARLLEAVAPWVRQLADHSRWPFAARLSAEQQRAARRISRAVLGW